jgi:[protein-PII] uridylyltransferase
LLEQLSPGLVPELRRYLTRHREGVDEMIRAASLDAGLPAGRRYTKIYDGMLSALFVAAQTAMQENHAWQRVSLAAVGSYGRGSLSPCSDLDVRLLCEGDAASAAPVAEALLYPLWDAGISIGHQVVTASEILELARQDLPTATTLLDFRRVAGDLTLSELLLERAFQGVFDPGNLAQFIDRLESSTRERHERFGGSVFLLEPDVRNGEGGLRDLDIAHWAARARWRVSDLQELVRIGVLVPREWTEIEEARSLLLRIRNLLHLGSGRRADRLSFEEQERISETLRYGRGGAAVERFMSDYYRRARAVTRARDMLLSRARPAPRRRPREYLIGRGLKLQGNSVSLIDPDALYEDPALALRVYDEAVRRELPVYDFARHALARAASNPSFCEALRGSAEAALLFSLLVCVIQQTKLKGGSVLKELHDVGLLVAMIPEFTPVVGRVHHDIYHVYTVDAHSVAALDQLRAFCRGDLATEHPLACRLAAELPRLRVLFFATLLHDIGKDLGGKDHSVRGAELSRRILERLSFAEADIVEVQNHVLNHLRMYHVATRRDLDDPRTLEEFCGNVRGQEALRELYLLTVADITTTSPVSMTSWKRRMLDQLFVLADRHCVGSQKRAPRTEVRQERVLEFWPKDRDLDFIRHFLSGLPERYLHANEPQDVIEHALFAERAQTHGSSVRTMSQQEPYLELWVVADDRPGLLALIAAALCRAKLKVLSAQVYSWIGQDGRSRSLDIFWVKSPKDASFAAELVPSVQRDLQLLLSGSLDPIELVRNGSSRTRWSSRPTPKVSAKVNLDNSSATNHTIVEVISRDRPALLFWLSSTLEQAELSIWFAKINTEGQRVADVFYVSNKSGGKILDPARLEDLEKRLLSTVARLEANSGPSA